MNNPIDRIQSYYDDLTKTDKEIALYIINNPRDVFTQTMDRLASKAGASKSAMSRFAQRIGYNGFTEFRYDMARFMVSSSSGDEYEHLDPVDTITKTYSDYILKLSEIVDRKQIDRIADLLANTNRIKIFGINRSGNSANQFKQRLARIGFNNILSENDNSTIGDLIASADETDVIVVFSTTDNTGYYSSNLKETKAKVIFITANPNLPIKKRCDEYVVVPRISRDSYASFLDDQAIFMVLIEILIEAMVRKSNVANRKG